MSAPLHVAVDANVLEARWGGIPKYLHRIAGELAAAGDRVDLLVNLREWATDVPGANAVPVRLKGRGPWRDLRVPVWALRARPDVYWAPEGVLPRRLPVPAVVTVHDLAPLLFPGSKPPEIERAYHTIHPRSARAAVRVICVSNATASDVVREWGVDRARIRVVGNGVDDRFTPGEPRRRAIEEPYVLHVGSLEPRKGLDVLIEAAARDPSWRLVLAGGPGHDGDRLLRAAEGAGALVLRDVGDEDLVDLYRGALALAAPAIYEGFGITPLEAMACGTPAVISAGAGALEEISGEAAVVVAERTPEAWLAGIERARDERASLRGRGLELAARHRWPLVASATRDVLREAAQAG